MSKNNKVTSGNIHKNGGKYWYYTIHYYDENNKRHTETRSTGLKATKKNEKAARAIRDKRLRELEETYNLLAKDLLFHCFLETYYATNDCKKGITEQTYISYKYLLKHSVEYFEKHPVLLVDVKPKTIKAYYEYLEHEKKLNPCTIAKDSAFINKALNYACLMEYIPSNPASVVKCKPKKNKPSKRACTIDEVNVVLKSVSGTKYFAPFWLCARFGLRRGEAVGLAWDNVDLDKGKLKICETAIQKGLEQKCEKRTKNETSKRIMSLSREDVQEFKKIRSWQQEQRLKAGCAYDEPEYVCVDEYGKVLKLKAVSSKFSQVCKEYGFEGVSLHSLRHFFSTILIQKGLSLAEISKAMGHSSIQTTADIYGHLSEETNDKISEKMNSVVNI